MTRWTSAGKPWETGVRGAGGDALVGGAVPLPRCREEGASYLFKLIGDHGKGLEDGISGACDGHDPFWAVPL